jgi:hypothetical protein
VHVAFEPGRAGEQSVFPGGFFSVRHPFFSWQCLTYFLPLPMRTLCLLGSVAKGPKFQPQTIKMSFKIFLLV